MEKITKSESYEMVGRFMNEWSYIEFGLDRVISGSLELSNTQSLAFSKALRFETKMTLIKLLINALLTNKMDNKKYLNLLKNIRSIYQQRNIIAHCHFRESKDGSHVEFLKVSVTKDKKGLIKERFSERNFIDSFQTMNNMHNNLEDLRKLLKDSSDSDKLINALSNSPPNLFTKDLQ